ncbi:MAG TPA: prenyltransferase/squalene oxidase repeat-containing protein [Gemmataceae bacterium]|nr:prenyltransferase/squalene oxidase repeat-containing protein [Gemmataceae bacterium]
MSRTLVLAALLAAGCSKSTPTTEAPAPAPKKPQPKPEPAPQPVAEPEPAGPEIAPYPRVAARRPDHALPDGVEFLLKQQSPDGAWRSDIYATFKDGTALTPHVVVTLQEAAAVGTDPKGAAEARTKGSAFLAKMVKPDGTINEGPDGIDYPAYTASLAVVALSHPENKAHLAARDAWVKYLLARQLTDALGWAADDKPFGGWGYCRVVPKKPEPNTIAPPLIESNISATLYALEALKAAGVTDKARHEAALFFVRRCQNWSIVPDTPDPGEEHRDGGFHFIYDDPVRNKAGEFATTEGRPGRFNSYGSATADGARALALCGKKEGPYIDDARTWLKRNFSATRHPGAYAKAMEPNRNAVYFYYCMSVAKALRDGGIADVNGKSWAYDLGYELTRR